MASLITFENTTMYSAVAGNPLVVGELQTWPVVADPLSVIAGSLPPGVTLTSNNLHGTPTTAGVYTFTLQSSVTTQQLQLEIFSSTPSSPLVANGSTGVGVVGQSFVRWLGVGGLSGSSSYVFTLTGGELPPGLSLGQFADAMETVALLGTPTTAGVFQFTLSYVGNLSDTGHQIVTIAINDVQLSSGEGGPLSMILPPVLAGVPYSFQLTQDFASSCPPSSGTPPYTFHGLAGGLRPPWMSISPAGLLTGMPPSGSGVDGSPSFAFQITYAPSGAGRQNLVELTVLALPVSAPGEVHGTYTGFWGAGQIGGGTI
jgi:hypothetical protein